ncbi:MAG: type IV pilus modification PilV family protein [Bacillota bacterium]
MQTYKQSINSKGFTLIEVLASIVILGIILITFLSFFSQSMMFSVKVEDKLSAANIAERILYEVKRTYTTSPNLIAELKDGTQACTASPLATVSGNKFDSLVVEDVTGRYYYNVNDENYYTNITICQSVDEKELDVYRVHVEIYDDNQENPIPLSEIYDYIDLYVEH